MSLKKPKRVRIADLWFDVSDGWAGALDLGRFMSPIKYKAKEAYAHIWNLFYVYDSSGNKVGEFNTEHKTVSGLVTDLEV